LNPSIEDKAAVVPVQKFLEAVRKGNLPADLESDREIKFYILGFSLNKARLALRFYYVCSVAELMERLCDHFKCLEMEHSEKDVPFPSIKHLLRETVFGKTPLDKDKNVSPLLGGALMRAVLTGANYPQSFYQGVIGRIRADRQINYFRASILKAVLQRNHNKEVPMSLDTERREISYLLGRLFAVLEKAQKDAIPGAKATIKDRFFSAASATPASVFPRLLRLSQHHIEKAEYGYISDRRISDIMEHIDSFPAHMSLLDQGLFAIAYYQQKNALYLKKETVAEGEEQ
jgi:CRISPR-associated protein Csd1